nr:hypothetical protein B0A51_18386 [Rachicladosporium sp. CCFEE 5018]
MRTSLGQFSFALIVLKIFTREFYSIGALFAVYGAGVLGVSAFRRMQGNRQFFSEVGDDGLSRKRYDASSAGGTAQQPSVGHTRIPIQWLEHHRSALPFAETLPSGLNGHAIACSAQMPFKDLHPEIREKIYAYAFSGSATDIAIGEENISAQRLSSLNKGKVCRGDTALFLVNRLVYSDAKHLLYDNREFVFASMQDFNRWIPHIAGNVQFIQHLTIGRSTSGLLRQCYELLQRATSLKSFQVTFSYAIKGTLKKHLDEH